MDKPEKATAAIERCLDGNDSRHALDLDPEVLDALNRPSMKAVKTRFRHEHEHDDHGEARHDE